MTISEFMKWMKERYPDLDGQLMEDITKKYGKFDSDSLEKVKGAIIEGYSYTKAPNVATINTLTKGMGLKREVTIDLKDFAYKCVNCGTLYRGRRIYYQAHCCPSCRKRTNYNPAIRHPKGVIFYMQDMCMTGWDDYYGGSRKEAPGECCPYYQNYTEISGPQCEDYGRHGSIRHCGKCTCRVCCKNFTEERVRLKG